MGTAGVVTGQWAIRMMTSGDNGHGNRAVGHGGDGAQGHQAWGQDSEVQGRQGVRTAGTGMGQLLPTRCWRSQG